MEMADSTTTADRKTELKDALRRQDADAVNRLLDADATLLDIDLWPPAIYDAKSLVMTRLLLERGLDPNRCSAPRLPLHLAVYQVLPEVIECLLNAGADPAFRNSLGETPLDLLDAYEARPFGDPDVHRIKSLLIEAGAKIDFLGLVRLGDRPQLEAVIKAGAPLHPDALHAAARSGRPEVADLLLRYGAEADRINEKKNTPLWFAAQSPGPYEGRIAVMKRLLEAEVDLHRRCEGGSTALHFAAWRGPAQVVEFLLSQGARANEYDDQGRTPTDYAPKKPESEDRNAIMNLLARNQGERR
jgi:ankyrin repeat protein